MEIDWVCFSIYSAIVRYLGSRFPETLSAVDSDDRTALHYAATIKDNGHFYNLLLHLGANAKAVDKVSISYLLFEKSNCNFYCLHYSLESQPSRTWNTKVLIKFYHIKICCEHLVPKKDWPTKC